MSTRESLYVVVESAYGTPKVTPVKNTDAWYFNLPESDSFQGLMSPQTQVIPYGGGTDSPFDAVNDSFTTQIQWKGFVYPTLDNILLNLAMQPVNTAQTLPWVTTEQVGDLASASFYKSWQPRVGALVRKRFAGCKVQQLSLSCSRQDPRLTFSATIVAQKEVGNPIDASTDPASTEFPDPACADLPIGPYLFSHSATNLKFGGSAVTNYTSLSLQVNNKLDTLWFENHFLTVCAMRGRSFVATFQRLLNGTPDYRGIHQEVTKEAFSLGFNNGTNGFNIDFGANCYVSAYAQNLGLGKEFLETITVTNLVDHTSCNDMTLTFT